MESGKNHLPASLRPDAEHLASRTNEHSLLGGANNRDRKRRPSALEVGVVDREQNPLLSPHQIDFRANGIPLARNRKTRVRVIGIHGACEEFRAR